MATTIENRPQTLDNNFVGRFGEYNTSVLRFPDDVSLSQSSQNYVIFYINVPMGSKTKLSGEKTLGVLKPTGNGTGGSAATAPVVGAALGATATLSMIAKAASLGVAGGVVAVGGAVLVGAGIGAGLASAEIQKSEYERISDAIVLGIVNMPNVSYSAKWEDVDLGTLGGLIAGGASSADMTFGNTASDVAKLALRNAVKIPGSVKSIVDTFGGLNPGAVISSTTKEVANPFREQIFKQVGFREFTFNYAFFPKDKEETERVRSIIEKFIFHMHPDLSESGLFFKFPSQFDIVYYFKDSENPYLRKTATCVLENCDIKYGQDGSKYASFVNGAPVEVFMTLKFKETQVLTKNSIKNGY